MASRAVIGRHRISSVSPAGAHRERGTLVPELVPSHPQAGHTGHKQQSTLPAWIFRLITAVACVQPAYPVQRCRVVKDRQPERPPRNGNDALHTITILQRHRTPMLTPLSSSGDDGDASWAVVCDFDGTISRIDGTDALLQQYALPGWQDLEARWTSGEITALECMQGQIAMLRVSSPQLEQFAAALPLDETFASFVAACARRGFPLVVASDGLDRIIQTALGRLGVKQTEVCAGRLEALGHDNYRLAKPADLPPCPSGGVSCKCAVATRLVQQPGPVRRRILLVGDGLSDFCVATHAADFVLARGKLLAHCHERGVPCLSFSSFTEAASLLGLLPPAGQRIDPPSTAQHWLQRTA